MENALEYAIQSLQSGDYARALEIFDILVKEPRYKSAVLGHRAWYYFQTGQYELALNDYGELRTVVKPEEQLNIDLLAAECFVAKGGIAEATDIMSAILKKDPTNKQLLYLILKLHNSSIDRSNYLGNANRVDPNVMCSIISSIPEYIPVPINHDIGLFLYSFIRNVSPGFVIEIGAFVGLSAIYMAQALRDNGAGRLFCFDLFQLDVADYLQRSHDQQEVFREHLKAAGLENIVSVYAGDSSQLLELTQLPIDKNSRGLIFIDGDHTLQGVIKDFNSILRYVRNNSYILIHDVNFRHSGWLGPALLAKKLLGNDNYNLLVMPMADNTGLAIIQSKDSDDVRLVHSSVHDIISHKLFHRFKNNKR